MNSNNMLDDFFEDNQDSDIENMIPDNQNVAKILQKSSHSIKEVKPQEQHCNILKQYFGHTVFRPLQWQIIQSILEEKRDNCVIMATGYGKSLCYQYPAVFTKGLSVVISPLISLMEDQVICLKNQNIPACFLGSAQNNKTQVINQLMNNHYRVVYMSPEYAAGEMGEDLLTRLHQATNICLLAIDEAHCVSQWGHAFRPQYRDLGKLRQLLPSVPILAVTTTATDAVTNDIIESLGLRSPQVLCSGFDRPNLFFEVRNKSASMFADLTYVIRENDAFNLKNSSMIIYCLTRVNTEKAASILKGSGFNCDFYHAGLPLEKRKKIHEQFINNEIQIIVATIAFGMGINKSDVRCVIHYGTSSEMEKYYQEAGRAGRDGLPALCVLYHSPKDLDVHKYFRDFSNLTAKLKAHKEALSIVMQRYVSTNECRRHYIISYFEGNKELQAEAKPNCCDNCTVKRNREGVMNVVQRPLIKDEPTTQVYSIQTEPQFDKEALLKELQNLKNSLENIRKMMPQTISVDDALQELLVLITSATINENHQVDEVSLHKIEQFGQSCVDIVENIVETNLPQEPTVSDVLRKYPLHCTNESEFVSVSMFKDGMEPHEIANRRNLSEDIVLEHLISGLEASSNVDIRRLLSASILSSIIQATQSPTVNYDLKKLDDIKLICAQNVSINQVKIAIAFLNVRIHLRNIPYKDDFAITTINNSTKFVSALVTPVNNWIPNLSKYSSAFVNDYEKSTIIKNDPDKEPKGNILNPCVFKYTSSSRVEDIFNDYESTIIKNDPDKEPKENILNPCVFKPSSQEENIFNDYEKSIIIKNDPDKEPKENILNPCVFKYTSSSRVEDIFNDYESTIIKNDPDKEPKENILNPCVFKYTSSSRVEDIFNDYESTIIKNDPDKEPKENILNPCVFKYTSSSRVEDIFNEYERTIIKNDPDKEPKENILNPCVFKYTPSSRVEDIFNNYLKSIIIKKDPDERPKTSTLNTYEFKYRPSSQVKNILQNYSEFQKRTPQKSQNLEDIDSVSDCIKLKPVPLTDLLNLKFSSPALVVKDAVDKLNIENGECINSINACMRMNNNNNEFDILSENKCNEGDFTFINSIGASKCEWDNDSMFSNNSIAQLDQVVIKALSQDSIHSNSQPKKVLESQLIADASEKTQRQDSLKRIFPEWMNNNTVFKNKIKKKKTVYID